MLNPENVRSLVDRPLTVELVAGTSGGYADMDDFLAPPSLTREERMELMEIVHRASDPGAPEKPDLTLIEQGLPCPAGAFTFYRSNPERTVTDVLEEREDIGLALARRFPAFRKPVVDRIVRAISRENAMFAIASALPNIIPSFLELPWSVGEFASDTAFITINQIRMAFLIAAATGRKIGYSEQPTEIVSIAAGALGWRALARELVGKIPLGGGLIPKGAIAYAGTYVIGKGIEHYQDVGKAFTRVQNREVYRAAYEHGQNMVRALLNREENPSAA